MMENNQESVGISAEVPDWSRKYKKPFTRNPSRALLASIRNYQRIAGSRNPWRIFLKKFAVLRHHFWSVLTGAVIPINSQIGGGLLIPRPNGVVIHPGTKIGPNCLIFQQVTIDTHDGIGSPIIGGHIDIGAAARVLKAVSISDHACIGTNAVVLNDIPKGKTAVGVPAKII